MNINTAFPSKYLKAADIGNREVKVVIDNVRLEDVGEDDEKLIIHFQGKQKGMVLNRTNANAMSFAYGEETDNWAGKPCIIFTTKVSFQGRMVDGLRLRVPPEETDADDDKIPF